MNDYDLIISLSELRQNIYNIADNVLNTGIPVYTKRKGKILKITVKESPDKFRELEKLQKRNIINGDPEDIVHLDWSKEWKGIDDIS